METNPQPEANQPNIDEYEDREARAIGIDLPHKRAPRAAYFANLFADHAESWGVEAEESPEPDNQ